MNSFTVNAVGYLSRDPEQIGHGNKMYTRFCLAGHDNVSRDGETPPRELLVSMWFTAFGALGEVIARNSRKGDQLIIAARVASHYDPGADRLEHTFIVTGFRFGATSRASRELSGREPQIAGESAVSGGEPKT